MTLAELNASKQAVINAINALNVAELNMGKLLSSLNKRLNIDDPLYIEPTQADVNAIVAVYAPLYTPIKAAIQTAANSLP